MSFEQTLILLFAFAVIVASFLIGWWAKRKVTSSQAYFGGTALFGPLSIALSSMAAVASAFALVGVPGLIYSTGNTMALWMLGSPAFALGYIILGKKVLIKAQVPQAEVFTYSRDLRSMTQGRGTFIVSVSHYERVPPEIQAKVVEAYQREREEKS